MVPSKRSKLQNLFPCHSTERFHEYPQLEYSSQATCLNTGSSPPRSNKQYLDRPATAESTPRSWYRADRRWQLFKPFKLGLPKWDIQVEREAWQPALYESQNEDQNASAPAAERAVACRTRDKILDLTGYSPNVLDRVARG